jgi:hypothetical protein
MDTHSSGNSPSIARRPLLRGALGAAALLAVLTLATGCVVAVRPAPVAVEYSTAPAEVEVTDAPPPALYETVGIAPGPGFVWVGGYYHWTGYRWAWYGGHYARPPRFGAVWIGPRYELRGARRVYIRGYWR